MFALMQDLRYAFRRLRKAPGFTVVATLTLAIGIGGMTAVFSVVDAVMLRPLPFENPGQLVSLHERAEGDSHELRVTAPDVLTFQRETRAFSGIGGFIGASYELTGAGAPFEARAERVTASLIPLLGVRPLLGRTFTQQEDDNAAAVALISYGLWKRRLHADPGILGTTIDLDRRPYTILGVMPPSFEFPLDAGRLSSRDLWMPMSFTPVEKVSEGDNFDYGAVARLKPGISMAQAGQDVNRIIARIQTHYEGKSDLKLQGYFLSLREEVIYKARPLLHMLLGAVALVLCIACVNLASLLSVRAAGRRREFGVRMALGATRETTFRQLIAESALLSMIGALLGTVLAVLLVHAAAMHLPNSLPRLSEIGVNWTMLVAAGVLTALTGLACGILPSLESLHANPLDSLHDGSQAAGVGLRQTRLRRIMVTVEIGMAMVLLVSSGLILRSFAKMLEVDPGFETSHLLTASLALPAHEYPTQQKVNAFLQELEQRLEGKHGVKSVGFSSNLPLVGQRSGRLIAPEGYVPTHGEGWNIASNYLVYGNYFEATRIPLIRGRYFHAADQQPGAPLVLVISQMLADRYFHGKNPIGMHIKVGPTFASPMPAMTIVGVVGDIKQGSRDEATVPQMYEPLAQAAAGLGPYGAMIGVAGNMEVGLQSGGDPATLEIALNQTVHQLDPLLAVSDVNTMDEIVAATESSRRFNTLIVTSFAAIALLLSLLGIYGVMAHSVSEGTREIAIRMALGATRGDVLVNTVLSALLLTALGTLIGTVASLALARSLASLLFGVTPLDAPTMAVAAGLLFLCSAVAAWLPARRASAVDPMQTLRAE